MYEKLVFWTVFFFAYIIQAITGFAGGLFSSPMGIHLLGLNNTLAIINLVGVFACGFVTLTGWRHVLWREVAKICVIMLLFMAVGFWLDNVLTLDWLFRIFGIFVLAVGVKNMFINDAADLPEWALYLILFCAGVIQGMFVCGGALLVMYALQKFRDKLQFRATMSAIWTILNFLYFLFLACNGYCNADVLEVSAVCIVISVATTYIGTKIAHRINQESFLKFVYFLLICVGVSCLITA